MAIALWNPGKQAPVLDLMCKRNTCWPYLVYPSPLSRESEWPREAAHLPIFQDYNPGNWHLEFPGQTILNSLLESTWACSWIHSFKSRVLWHICAPSHVWGVVKRRNYRWDMDEWAGVSHIWTWGSFGSETMPEEWEGQEVRPWAKVFPPLPYCHILVQNSKESQNSKFELDLSLLNYFYQGKNIYFIKQLYNF